MSVIFQTVTYTYHALLFMCRIVTMKGLTAKRIRCQKVKIEFLAVLCCHLADSYTLIVLAQIRAEVPDSWQNALSVIKHGIYRMHSMDVMCFAGKSVIYCCWPYY